MGLTISCGLLGRSRAGRPSGRRKAAVAPEQHRSTTVVPRQFQGCSRHTSPLPPRWHNFRDKPRVGLGWYTLRHGLLAPISPSTVLHRRYPSVRGRATPRSASLGRRGLPRGSGSDRAGRGPGDPDPRVSRSEAYFPPGVKPQVERRCWPPGAPHHRQGKGGSARRVIRWRTNADVPARCPYPLGGSARLRQRWGVAAGRS
jgi:hypothetical protein